MHQERPTRKGRWVIVTDGVFSMDGDFAALSKLCELKERFEALLMVDDAHGTGAWGAKGRGLGEYLGCLDKIDLHMGTLGKALGRSGAYLAADRVTIDMLINRSRPFIFSTSLPPSVPASAIAAKGVKIIKMRFIIIESINDIKAIIAINNFASGFLCCFHNSQVPPATPRGKVSLVLIHSSRSVGELKSPSHNCRALKLSNKGLSGFWRKNFSLAKNKPKTWE